MIDYQPTAGHIQAALLAGLKIMVVEHKPTFWMGKTDQLRAQDTYYKNIIRERDVRGKSVPKGCK